jgi:hypothetical protein
MLAAYNRLSEGPGIEPHPHLVIVGDGEERGGVGEGGRGYRFQRNTILRVSKSVGAAEVLRYRQRVRFYRLVMSRGV